MLLFGETPIEFNSGSVGRALDLGSKGCSYESLYPRSHSHYVVFLSKTLYPLLRAYSNQEDSSRHDWKIVDWDLKNQSDTDKKKPIELLDSDVIFEMILCVTVKNVL